MLPDIGALSDGLIEAGCAMLPAAECFRSEYMTLSSLVYFRIALGAGDGFLVPLACFKSA